MASATLVWWLYIISVICAYVLPIIVFFVLLTRLFERQTVITLLGLALPKEIFSKQFVLVDGENVPVIVFHNRAVLKHGYAALHYVLAVACVILFVTLYVFFQYSFFEIEFGCQENILLDDNWKCFETWKMTPILYDCKAHLNGTQTESLFNKVSCMRLVNNLSLGLGVTLGSYRFSLLVFRICCGVFRMVDEKFGRKTFVVLFCVTVVIFSAVILFLRYVFEFNTDI